MNVSEDTDYLEARAAALHTLRSARRKNRIKHVDLFEAFYKAYVSAILGGIALYAIAGWLGDDPVSQHGLQTLRDDGAGYLGVFVALLVAVGLRSASRGGPLAFEIADIRHVMLAPVDRRDSLRSAAWRSMRHTLFVGATVGAAAGVIATRRLDEPVLWIGCGVLFGFLAAAVAYGVAMVASGFRLKSWLCDVIALLCLGWAGADAITGLITSPFSCIGDVALWPVEFQAFGLAGVSIALAAVVAGVFTVEGMSLEAAERRSKLVGQLRFAATMQDVRTVMLLQRQLAQQHLRVRPWVRLPRAKVRSAAGNLVFMRRSTNSLLRWPLVRIVRLFALIGVAAASVVGVWAGTSPLVVVAGVALWIAAIDLLEPLAQDTDHPDRLASAPVVEGIAHMRHLIVPGLVLGILTFGASIPLLIAAPSEMAGVFMPQIFPIVVLALGGAALVVSRPPYVGGGANALMPEIAGVGMFLRMVVPPLLPVIGLLPIAIARAEWFETHNAAQANDAIGFVSAMSLAFATWSILWIRYQQAMRDAFANAGAQAASKKEEQK